MPIKTIIFNKTEKGKWDDNAKTVVGAAGRYKSGKEVASPTRALATLMPDF